MEPIGTRTMWIRAVACGLLSVAYQCGGSATSTCKPPDGTPCGTAVDASLGDTSLDARESNDGSLDAADAGLDAAADAAVSAPDGAIFCAFNVGPVDPNNLPPDAGLVEQCVRQYPTCTAPGFFGMPDPPGWECCLSYTLLAAGAGRRCLPEGATITNGPPDLCDGGCPANTACGQHYDGGAAVCAGPACDGVTNAGTCPPGSTCETLLYQMCPPMQPGDTACTGGAIVFHGCVASPASDASTE
jgi:hypothetical protein